MKFIRLVWSKWTKTAKILGYYQAQIIFSLFYYILLWPAGLAIRLFLDPLHIKNDTAGSRWIRWNQQPESIRDAAKQ